MAVEYVVAKILLAEAFKRPFRLLLQVLVLFWNGLQHFGLQFVHAPVAFLFRILGGVQCVVQPLAKPLLDVYH